MSSDTNSHLESDVLFTLSKNQVSSTDNENEHQTEQENLNIDDFEGSTKPDTILCVLWNYNKLGAAYYKISDHQLYVFQETIDFSPEFMVIRSMYREVNPYHTITFGAQGDHLIQCLINMSNNKEQDTTSTSDSSSLLPPNLNLLHYKDYSFEACENKIYELNLPGEPENATTAQKLVFLHSLIDFNYKMSVHALGALIKFLEKHWAHLNSNEDQELRFLHVNQISICNHVFMDKNTFDSLHIFQTQPHDAKFKHGGESSNSEGFSIFKLLSQHCKSKLGLLSLRSILMNPIQDIAELNSRLDFIQFIITPKNQGFMESLQDSINKITDLNKILQKLQHTQVNYREWETLYNTIYNILFFNELCGSFRKSSILLTQMDESITTHLYNLQHTINNVFDFSNNTKQSRPVIKFGLDAELDAKKLKRHDIAKNIAAAAKFAVNQLPPYLNECSVVHVPQMGHLVAVKEWEPNCDRNKLQECGFQFMFEVKGLLHYKNAMCLELDKQLGNIHHEILAHENRIIQRLSGFVLKHNKDIREPLNIIGFIDCLISIALVSRERGYVRPTLNQNGIHEIKGGKHPLLELLGSNFVSNDYVSGGDYSRIKIITGPNNSGKSVYLKQTAVLIFLAHIGCYIPATKANISMTHSFHSQIHATESAGVSLSAFMQDISQMSQALHNARNSSLVIIDEFGRGTTGDDGIALLIGALKKFHNQNHFCPHILVSTHYQQICNFLSSSNILSYLKMDYTRQSSDELVFLYSVVEGMSESFAFDVASTCGLEDELIGRARQIYASLRNNSEIPYMETTFPYNFEEFNFCNINIPPLDE